MVYDFHSHVLYGVDDGAKDIAMSQSMLKASKAMGVTDILLTSHCYPATPKDITNYIATRDARYDEVIAISDIPRLYKGCEVHLTSDLSRFRNVKELCIENTDYMLLEMPHTPWNDKVIEVVYKLTLMGIRPIIAHDERNMHQRRDLRNALYDLDVLIQINAPSLFMRGYKKEIDKMMRLGLVHVIGTDMHNTTSRKPCLDKAKKRITKRYGADCWDYMMSNSEKILKNEKISYSEFKSFKKKSIL